MWSPTHVQVLVKKARGLKIKGKDGTNDAFVTIGLGKEKYQTSVKEKATESVEWCEQCELTIPAHGNTAEIVLTALHRNFLGVDEFLGMVSIPLRDFDVYDRPRTKWYTLKCKPGQSKNDYRGDLEVRTAFTVKAVSNDAAAADSTADLSNKSKHKGSLQSLNKAAANFGGSLLNIGQKEKKHLKKIAKTVTNKVEKVGEKAKKNLSKNNSPIKEEGSFTSSNNSGAPGGGGEKFDNSLNRFSDPFAKIKGAPSRGSLRSGRRNLDPGVNSEDEDDDDMFKFDTLSHGSSGSSLNMASSKHVDNLGTVSKSSTPLTGSLENLGGGELLRRTPGVARRGFAPPQDSPLVLSENHHTHHHQNQNSSSSSSKSPKVPTTQDMDEWELKLLGKKGVPYTPTTTEFKNQRDNLSLISGMSLNSGHSAGLGGVGNTSATSSRANTLERTSRFNQSQSSASTLPMQTPSGHKKKIIPVHSDFESSPSPEDSPSSPNLEDSRNSSKLNTPTRKQQQQADQQNKSNNVITDFDNHPYNSNNDVTGGGSGGRAVNERSDSTCSSSTGKKKRLNLGKFGKSSLSFRGEKDRNNDASNDSLNLHSAGGSRGNKGGGHVRTYSDGSAGSNGSSGMVPPSGPRVVLGRETTPTELPQKIPKDVWDKFDGKSREDLIEMIVSLQTTIESQAKKHGELEDYIDSLLMKVLSTAPQLLQKNNGAGGGHDDPSSTGRSSSLTSGFGINLTKKFGLW